MCVYIHYVFVVCRAVKKKREEKKNFKAGGACPCSGGDGSEDPYTQPARRRSRASPRRPPHLRCCYCSSHAVSNGSASESGPSSCGLRKAIQPMPPYPKRVSWQERWAAASRTGRPRPPRSGRGARPPGSPGGWSPSSRGCGPSPVPSARAP